MFSNSLHAVINPLRGKIIFKSPIPAVLFAQQANQDWQYSRNYNVCNLFTFINSLIYWYQVSDYVFGNSNLINFSLYEKKDLQNAVI